MLIDLVQRGEGSSTVSRKVSWRSRFVSWLSITRVQPIIEPFWAHGCSHAHRYRWTIKQTASQRFCCFSFVFFCVCVCVVSNWCSLTKRMGKKCSTRTEKRTNITFLSDLSCSSLLWFFPLQENTWLAIRKVHKDTCLGGDAISPNGGRAASLSSLCFTVVFPEDGVIEWTDRVDKEDETDGEVNGFPLVHLGLYHRCTVALPVAS